MHSRFYYGNTSHCIILLNHCKLYLYGSVHYFSLNVTHYSTALPQTSWRTDTKAHTQTQENTHKFTSSDCCYNQSGNQIAEETSITSKHINSLHLRRFARTSKFDWNWSVQLAVYCRWMEVFAIDAAINFHPERTIVKNRMSLPIVSILLMMSVFTVCLLPVQCHRV